MSITTVSQSMPRAATIEAYLNIPNRKALTDKQLDLLIRVMGKLSIHNVDNETAVAIIQSYEHKFGQADELQQRLHKFDAFLESIGARSDLIDSVKNIGMLSKTELEEQARETGDWIPAIKKISPKEKPPQAAKADEKKPAASPISSPAARGAENAMVAKHAPLGKLDAGAFVSVPRAAAPRNVGSNTSNLSGVNLWEQGNE